MEDGAMPETETETITDEETRSADLGDGGKKALESEREARKALEKQLKDATRALEAAEGKVRQFEDRDKSENDKLSARIKELETALAERDSDLSKKDKDILRRDVARTKGVPVSAVTGDTQEEMEASADDLLEWRGTPQVKKATGFQSGASAPTGANEKEKAAAAIRAMRRGA
jgi:DNA repair exonuclease SbcCD ATPase subunit